ncbi:hypothetical protein [Amycolatopsis sp. NPDC051371]|uniref:hypothetical protein n=1 Tax=Amycolatopsis sp. NPDC051371 TaxID=3155800 RepID=UPI00341EF893
MRTFHDILADIERELAAADIDQQLAAADTIPTDAPAPVAAYLRALLNRHARWATGQDGTVTEDIPADAIRPELHPLHHATQPSTGRGERNGIPCHVGCGHIDCDDRPF